MSSSHICVYFLCCLYCVIFSGCYGYCLGLYSPRPSDGNQAAAESQIGFCGDVFCIARPPNKDLAASGFCESGAVSHKAPGIMAIVSLSPAVSLGEEHCRQSGR